MRAQRRAQGRSRRRSLAAFAVPLAALLAGLCPAARAGAERSPHDVTTYGVVWRVPAMADVQVESGLPFGDGERTFDLYRPPAAGASVPLVVFANVTGARFQDWEIYRDWARLVAAHGMAGIVYQNDGAHAERSLTALVDHLRAHATELGVDPTRLALWACSANVGLALPWLHATPPPAVAAAVVYYGHAPVRAPRADLPVFYVLAGRDSPALVAGIRELFGQAVAAGAPWTMVDAPTLTHAFDALDQGVEAQRTVKETVAWLVDRLVSPPAPGPPPDLPRQALTHAYGQEWEAAAAALRAILAADPEDRAARAALGAVLARGGQDGAAIPELRRVIAAGEPGAGPHLNLGQALVRSGAVDDGLAEIAIAVAQGAHPTFAYAQLGLPAMNRGDFTTAIRIWEGAAAAPVPDATRRTLLYNLACAYARAGRSAEALDRLGRAIDLGFGPREAVAGDEDLAGLRGDPRFAALLERVAPVP